jgi:hypothetical protein
MNLMDRLSQVGDEPNSHHHVTTVYESVINQDGPGFSRQAGGPVAAASPYLVGEKWAGDAGRAA